MAQGDITRIASNISGMNALNALKAVNQKLGIHQLRLSTGKRINEAADDPAGLTIATKLNYKSRGLGVALDNIGDAKNLLGVAEGSLNKISDILLLIRDKAEQAANDTLGTAERQAIKSQIEALVAEIDTIVDETEWNGQSLIGASATSMTFQTGFQSTASTEVNVFKPHDASTLGIATVDVESHASATAYMDLVDQALATVSSTLKDIGAIVSRLTFKEENLIVAKTNTEAAYNRIMNADIAAEQLEAMKYQILQQTATAMLAQANVAPQAVLGLFR
ncbi:MAG: flagellin [Firmicutes bacterium]|jgi:flagellin|nr:flagellin [Bacillota bacterium]MDH7496363.1 flagellin [Bacillota bacterium]